MAFMTKSKEKLLVANRSEIACRVFQGAREMGITPVALFAPGDEEARHLTYASEIISVSSYLAIEEIVAQAKKAGITMIHPGYGFLSERAPFASAVEKAGIRFLGPSAETITAMGEKTAAKEIAEKAKVPTLPWARVQPGADLKREADRIGYPLLLKAAAGGGGKGMRKVLQASELEEAAAGASREALASFGDGTLFLEKLLESPRHIEVQVFGDGKGKAVHLYERECSLQRRHQKIWEEARAPHLSEKTRESLYAAAIRLTESVRYRSAGTLEFLVDSEEGFYFLEMNTRLQVEHTVSEQVTGIDLVHAQIRQALDPNRPALPEIPSARGHAIEVRLIAEDAAIGFAPTPGKIEALRWPTGPGIRVDSGIEEGQTIGASFDSMCAKLIVTAENRSMAIERMKYALSETVILGLGTNLSFLSALCQHPGVREGKVSTATLTEDFSNFEIPMTDSDLAILSAAHYSRWGQVNHAHLQSDTNGRSSSQNPFLTYPLNNDSTLNNNGAEK